MEASPLFKVIVCDVNTGIVCRPDGLRWRSDIHSTDDKYLFFPSHELAMDFIRISCDTRPQLECNLYQGDQHLGRFTSTTAAG